MKTRNLANYLIATVVVLCSLVLFATLVAALTGYRMEPPGRTLNIDFRDVAGIDVGSPVRLAGKPAGEVIEIRHLTGEERQESGDPSYVLRVTVELDDDLPALTQDVASGIASESFLGEKYVALTPGSVGAAPLSDGAVIKATGQGFMDTLQQAGANLESVLNKLNNDYDQLLPRLSGFLEHADALVLQGTNLMGELTGTVLHFQTLAEDLQTDYSTDFGPRVTSVLEQVQILGTNANQTVLDLNTNTAATLSKVRDLLESNEANLEKMISELRVVSQNLKVVSTYAKALTGTLGEKPSRLIWGRKKRELPSEQKILDNPEPVEIPLNPNQR